MSHPIPFQIVTPLRLTVLDDGMEQWRAEAEIGGIIYAVSRSLDEDEWFIDSERNDRTGKFTMRDRRSRIIQEVAEYLDDLTDIHAKFIGRDL